MSKGERNTLIAFGVAITLWTLPGLVGLFLGDDSSLYEGLTDRWLDEGVVAGLAKSIGEGLANPLNVSSLIAITIVCVVIAVIISETTSNTASAATSGPSSAWSGWP